MKGGVGKTTLAVNLAWVLCRRFHKKVLLVDLDPQFNASQYLMIYEEWEKHKIKKGTVADILTNMHQSLMKFPSPSTKKPKIDARKYLFEKETTANGGRLDILPSELSLALAIKNPHGVPQKLENYLKQVSQYYDYIIIDCAPTDSVLTDTALMASDYILVPVKPDRFSILGYAQIQGCLTTFKNTYHDPHNTKDLGVVFTQVQDEQGIEYTCIEEVISLANHTFSTKLKSSRSYLRSVHEKTPISDTKYSHLVTRTSIERLIREIERRIRDLSESPTENK